MPEQKARSFRIWEPLLIAVSAAIGLIAGYNMDFAKEAMPLILKSDGENRISNGDGKVEEILRFIEINYVDSLNQEVMTVDAIRHILKQLDPHSSYITEEELNDHNERMEGRYKGIGIETLSLRDTFYVGRIVSGGPADRAGLKVGDAIISINESIISGTNASFSSIRNYFRAEDDEIVDVKILRIGQEDPIVVKLEPEELSIPTANIAYLLNENTGYIRLSRFSGNTYEQFMESVEKLIDGKQSLNLVIDLRDNPGGYLPEAIQILSQLFEERDRLLCYTEGLNRKRAEYHSTGKNFHDIEKLVVLINKNAASGSEILAGAIQDWDRGVVIGETSFGKGLVQEIFPLNNGGALRLTVAKYYTPSGRLIQKSYDNIHRDFKGDTTEFKTRLLKRDVIGGGGVTPDITIKDPYNEYCIAYIDFIDFFILNQMKIKGTTQLLNSDLSQSSLDDFILKEYNEDSSLWDDRCDIDMDSWISARYYRMFESNANYVERINKDDEFISKALEFIQTDRTTMSLLAEKN